MGFMDMVKGGAVIAQMMVVKEAGKTYGYDSSQYADAYGKLERQRSGMSKDQQMDFDRLKKPV